MLIGDAGFIQQNSELGLPLQLSQYEAALASEQGACTFGGVLAFPAPRSLKSVRWLDFFTEQICFLVIAVGRSPACGKAGGSGAVRRRVAGCARGCCGGAGISRRSRVCSGVRRPARQQMRRE